ncbi:MAG: hydrogenase/urease maturation nickel metallochaperone HypA [bacterium]
MHDFHEADKILKLILTQAETKGLKKVRQAKIKLGRIIEHGEAILPENLAFNIKMLAKQTLAEGLELLIEEIGENLWELVEIEGE